jgi:predicted DsbA family dithiol-disulfide isomerase
MIVEIWSDVACPWCYVGKRRFEAALAEFEYRDQVEVAWRSFELDPAAPRELAADRGPAHRREVRHERRAGARDGAADDRNGRRGRP